MAFVCLLGHSDVRLAPVVDAVRGFSRNQLLLAAAFALLQVLSQAARFAILVPKSLGIGWLRAFRVTAVGQMLNIVLPARGGDVYKVLALCPGRDGARMQALGVVAADKASDVAGLSIAILLLGLGPALHLVSALQKGGKELLLGAALVGVACLVAVRLRAMGVVRPLFAVIANFCAGLAGLRNPFTVAIAVSLGTAAWMAEVSALVVLTRGVGCSLSHSQALLALLALNVGIAVPLLPANLGSFEAGIVLGLHGAGVPPVFGLAIAFAHHGIELGATGLFGGASVAAHAFAGSRHESALVVRDFDKNRALRHYEKSSARYETQVKRGPLRFMRDRERASVLRLLGPLNAGETFLDVGCGGGFYALHAKRAAMLVCAVDAAPGMIDKLKSQVDEALVRDVETLQFVGRRFDRVVCAGVMDFVAKPEIAIANLLGYVAPGGVLVILAPRTGWRGAYYLFEKLVVGLRVNRFAPQWFATEATRYGFCVTSLDLPLPHNLVVRLECGPDRPPGEIVKNGD